nr:hypothetical protein [uncultured archaeon]
MMEGIIRGSKNCPFAIGESCYEPFRSKEICEGTATFDDFHNCPAYQGQYDRLLRKVEDRSPRPSSEITNHAQQ